MNCPRCAAPTPQDDLQRFSGVCLSCAYAFASEEDPPEIPGFQIVGVLGKGGMGVVYRAVQTHLGRTVALKILAPHVEGRREFVDRFVAEGKTLAQLAHPNIVTIHDAAVHEGLPYLVMELVEGESLRRVLSRGKMSPERALDVISQVASGLQFAHGRGVVHRDIKPENILVGSDGRVRIADFGLAKLLSPEGGAATRTNVLLGTPRYMAPEQMETPARTDARSDLYALGAVYYELLTGSSPLGRFPRPSELAPVEGRTEAVVLKLLEREPDRRYRSAGEVQADLLRLAPVGASARTVVLDRSRSRAGGWALAVGVTAALIAGAAWLARRPVPVPEAPLVLRGEWSELGESATGEGVSRGSGNGGFSSLALDADGNPVLAWDGGPGPKPESRLRRWNGREWEQLAESATGGGISRNPGLSQEVSLALDSTGRPIVAWRDDTSLNWEIYLRRWDGTRWEELDGSGSGGGLSVSPGVSWGPSVQVDALGNPVVAWHDGSSGRFQIYLRRWDGEKWGDLGGSVGGDGLSRRPGGCEYPRLALDREGKPTVAWHDFTEAGQSVHLLRWDGRAWKELGGSNAEGGLTGFLDLSIGGMKLDAQGYPIVTWVDKVRKVVHLRRWNGRDWVGVGGSDLPPGLNRTQGAVVFSALALDAAGRPIVAWMDDSTGNAEIYLRRWDGSSWVEVSGSASGGGISGTPGESAAPSVAIDAQGRITVAWHEVTATGTAIWLRRWTPAP